MIRKFLYLAGAGLMLTALMPATAQADPTDAAAATITGTVTTGGPACTTLDTAKYPSATWNSSGNKVVFGAVAMAGTFETQGNAYVGNVAVVGPAIEACSAWLVPAPPPPPPPPPAVVGHGHIWGGYAFEGNNADTGKCLRGNFHGGDFVNVGVAATVKFTITYRNGFLQPDGSCEFKTDETKQVHCVGTFNVIIMPPPGPDRVTGEIACNQNLPTNGKYPSKTNP